MELELIGIVGVLLVVGATTLAPRLGVASPLLLVALGFGVSMLPFVDPVTIPPELILTGILPPLLYAAAVDTPVMEFRRDFRMISVFSVVLVLLTAVVVGFLVTLLVPGVPLGIGIALGAIVSPTDAVATSIVRRAGVSPRIVTILEGESMLNDATALVLLRAAVASVGVGVSIWDVGVQFVWAVAAAVVIGVIVGRLNLALRGRIGQEAPNVALSLIVPFVAYLPAEELGASGLVAAVVAGLVTGYGAPRRMGASVRMAEGAVWSTIALLLESAVFLLVGLELPTLVADVAAGGEIAGLPVLLAIVLGAVVVAVRTVMVAWSLWALKRRNDRSDTTRERLDQLQAQLDAGEVPKLGGQERKQGVRFRANRRGRTTEELLDRWRWGLTQRRADLDYLAAEKLGWREGVILVWAGMRGAVTIAAAQSLPTSAPHRSLVILVAVLVAVGTLVLQGISLGPLAQRLGLTGGRAEGTGEQWDALQAELDQAAMDDLASSGSEKAAEMVERMRARLDKLRNTEDGRLETTRFTSVRLRVLESQRNKLLELRELGTYPSAMTDDALAQLDAEQIGIELRQQYA